MKPLTTMIAGLAAPVVLLCATLVASPATAAAGQAADDEPTACERLWAAFPDQLQEDIRAAVRQPLRERRADLREIRRDALAGGYGEQVQEWAQRVKERRIELWQEFPEELKADVRAALALPLRQQRRAMVVIRHAALQGEYGEWVQGLAERRQAFVQGCPRPARPFVSAGSPLAQG